MKIRDYAIRIPKFIYRTIFRPKFLEPECIIDRDQANDEIYSLLVRDAPCMISRFGTTELNCINNYLCIHDSKPIYKKLVEYITDYTHTPWWNEGHFYFMSVYSGIFPPNAETAEKFSERYLMDTPEIDLLGSFQYFEKFMPLADGIPKVQLETLYPFFCRNPWTKALEGKKVLVVHPFDKTIERQYQKRTKIFSNPEILPSFELITMQAVQSIAGSPVGFANWFEALKSMEEKINSIDFDICILGCGAYGLPLAAHVKRLGKKAVHLGGGTQLLFGIKGKRWEEQYASKLLYRGQHEIDVDYKKLFNADWIYPLDEERPINASKVENACYW